MEPANTEQRSRCEPSEARSARAAFDTGDGVTVLQRPVLPSAYILDGIGPAGRSRTRRLSEQAIDKALDAERTDMPPLNLYPAKIRA